MPICTCEGCGAQADEPGEPCYSCRGGGCLEDKDAWDDPVIGDIGFLVFCAFLILAAALTLAVLNA